MWIIRGKRSKYFLGHARSGLADLHHGHVEIVKDEPPKEARRVEIHNALINIFRHVLHQCVMYTC